MNFTVWTLFKLDLKSRHGSTKAISTKDHLKRFFNVALSIVLYAVLIAVFYYLTEMFVVKSQLGFEFLVIVTFVALILLTIVGTGNVVKNLYFSGDNELLLRFPVSGKDVLIAKSIYCFVSNLIICFLLLFPFYIIFGALSGMNVGYYFLSIIVMFLISLVPFFVANLIAIPIMQLVNHVKDKFLLILIVLILLLCGGFILYMQLLKEVVQYIENNNINLFSPEMTQNIKAFANGCYPFRFYADVLAYSQVEGGAGQVFLNLLYIVLIEAAIAVCAYFTTIKCYYKTILYSIETGKTALTTKSKIVLRSQFSALFRKEFLLIFRSFNYSFQYLAMAVAAPVMVYYCNDLAVSYGQSTVGSAIVPGLTLMVITLFTTIIVSFASTTVSREGMCFYHTKIIPVSYKNQVLVRSYIAKHGLYDESIVELFKMKDKDLLKVLLDKHELGHVGTIQLLSSNMPDLMIFYAQKHKINPYFHDLAVRTRNLTLIRLLMKDSALSFSGFNELAVQGLFGLMSEHVKKHGFPAKDYYSRNPYFRPEKAEIDFVAYGDKEMIKKFVSSYRLSAKGEDKLAALGDMNLIQYYLSCKKKIDAQGDEF